MSLKTQRLICLSQFISYLKSKNVVPQGYNGKIVIDELHWHCLEVTDLDGKIDQNIPVARAGNTGDVWSQGSPVPDHQKGNPPYPGLHEHLETAIRDENLQLFNIDKDKWGRIDPFIILNYIPMDSFKSQTKKQSSFCSKANITR